ncbi:ubiquitin-like domain-containing protein [Gemmiger formicilis]|nr:ubiquitin-like domain-containing protein [Gemmiger formicilis]
MALSVKTREHIRRWAALAGPKWGALLGGAAALAAAIAFTGAALHFTTVADTHGDTVRILTAATDLAAVLQQSDTPPLGEHDEAVWSQTEDGERLDVLRAYTVPVTADGAMQELTVTGTHTTAELLERAGLTYTADDLLTPQRMKSSPRAAASRCSALPTTSTLSMRSSPPRSRRSRRACSTASRARS